MLQTPSSLRANSGPPGCPSSTSGPWAAVRHSSSPAERFTAAPGTTAPATTAPGTTDRELLHREQPPDVVEGVGLGGRLVLAVAQHPGEAQRDPAGVARRGLHAVARRSRRRARGARRTCQPSSDTASSCSRAVCQRSSSSVRPLKVLPSITKPPAGSRAPRCRLDSRPVRRPCPHSTPRTTRSRVCRGLTLSQAAPRRPAAYGASSALTTTPSWPRASASAANASACGGVGLAGRPPALGHDAGPARRPEPTAARRAGRRRPGAAGRRRTG